METCDLRLELTLSTLLYRQRKLAVTTVAPPAKASKKKYQTSALAAAAGMIILSEVRSLESMVFLADPVLNARTGEEEQDEEDGSWSVERGECLPAW